MQRLPGIPLALFIAGRTSPISYNKWIHGQIVEILGLPELYELLPRLFQIKNFESEELVQKAEEVERLLDEYAPPGDQRRMNQPARGSVWNGGRDRVRFDLDCANSNYK